MWASGDVRVRCRNAGATQTQTKSVGQSTRTLGGPRAEHHQTYVHQARGSQRGTRPCPALERPRRRQAPVALSGQSCHRDRRRPRRRIRERRPRSGVRCSRLARWPENQGHDHQSERRLDVPAAGQVATSRRAPARSDGGWRIRVRFSAWCGLHSSKWQALRGSHYSSRQVSRSTHGSTTSSRSACISRCQAVSRTASTKSSDSTDHAAQTDSRRRASVIP